MARDDYIEIGFQSMTLEEARRLAMMASADPGAADALITDGLATVILGISIAALRYGYVLQLVPCNQDGHENTGC